MHVAKIYVENFKRFEGKFSLELAPGLNILVGDNEVGKTTILEAVHLALTGALNGRPLRHELTQSLFKNIVVETYLSSLSGASPLPPPEIVIEAHLVGSDLALFEGNDNHAKTKGCGIVLRVAFAEKYQAEYEALTAAGPIRSLPIEFYEVSWRSFARQEVFARAVPVKSALIDSSNTRFQNGTDIYVSRIVRDLLSTDDIVRLTQAHRSMRDAFTSEAAVDAVNKKIQASAALTTKKVHLSAELSSTNSWEQVLITYVDNVPFHQIGRGEQSVVKTRLALGHKKSKEANVLLVEEPENHLSHSKLNELVSAIQSDGGERQILVSTHSSFVANKLGLQHLLLLTHSDSMRLTELSEHTQRYFQRLPGYDTLRLALCKKAILVEGPSDELVVQKAYCRKHSGRLPIQDGVDVISVGTSFLRFLELSERLKIPTVVVTDNDGNVTALEKKYEKFLVPKSEHILISYDPAVDPSPASSSGVAQNRNTLEPKILKANSLPMLNTIFGTEYKTSDDLLTYMRTNKTDCALAIFETDVELVFPGYIDAAVS